MAQPALWPDSFMRKMHGRDYCPIDDQGVFVDATSRDNGWLCGPMGQTLCWIPPAHRQRLLQRTVSVFEARETTIDLRNFVYGTMWEQRKVN